MYTKTLKGIKHRQHHIMWFYIACELPCFEFIANYTEHLRDAGIVLLVAILVVNVVVWFILVFYRLI